MIGDYLGSKCIIVNFISLVNTIIIREYRDQIPSLLLILRFVPRNGADNRCSVFTMKSKAYILLVVILVVASGAVSGCSENPQPKQEISRIDTLYQQGETSKASNLAMELLSQYSEDVVVLSDLSQLANKYDAKDLSQTLDVQLPELVNKYKRIEVFITLMNVSSVSAPPLFLSRNKARLDESSEAFLSALSKYNQNDYAAAFEELGSIGRFTEFNPKLRYLVIWLSIHCKIYLGDYGSAEDLRNELNGLHKEIGIYSSMSTEYFNKLKNQASEPNYSQHYIQESERDLLTELSTWEKPQKNTTDVLKPQVCRGRNVVSGIAFWGVSSVCEDGAGMIGNDKPRVGFFARGESLPVAGNCCQLPKESMFSNVVTYEEEQCPKDSIVTAAIARCGFADRLYRALVSSKFLCPTALECRQLNREEFKLLPPEKAIHFGNGFTAWLQGKSVSKFSLPRAVHRVLGRYSKHSWRFDGCTGASLGAFLVAKKGRRCYDHFYSSIVFKQKHPETGVNEKVQIFPDCKTYVDPYSRDNQCNSS